MEAFCDSIKQELVMNQHYFSFYEIPDLIVKKNYSRKDYEEIILKVLNKVKLRYLAEKKNTTGADVKNVCITDDDLIPLEMLDWVLSQIEHKHLEKAQTFQNFIRECNNLVQQKISKMAIDSDKTKKIVEKSILINHINQYMEQNNAKYFTNNFIHRNMYVVFCR